MMEPASFGERRSNITCRKLEQIRSSKKTVPSTSDIKSARYTLDVLLNIHGSILNDHMHIYIYTYYSILPLNYDQAGEKTLCKLYRLDKKTDKTLKYKANPC